MPVSSRCRPCEFISTTNRKCHKLFAVFLVNIWIVQSCYFVHCLHLPRCLYYTQCHHSMSSFSPLPYLHYLLHHLHRCINFLLIFPTVLAFIIIVLTSITAINAIAKVFASIYMFLIFITVSFFSSSVFLLFFILMGVVLIVIIVSTIIGIILEDTSCSCLHPFFILLIFINFSFFSSVFLLLFFITVFILMDVVLIFIIVSIIIEVTSCSCFHQFLYFTHIHQFLPFLFFCLPSHLLHHCLNIHPWVLS